MTSYVAAIYIEYIYIFTAENAVETCRLSYVSKVVVAGTAGTAMAVPIIRPTMYYQS